MNKELQKALIILKREIPKKVMVAAAQSMNENTIDFFNNHPRGIGVTGTIMKPINISGNRSTDIITMFPEGYPAILELGVSGNKPGYTYPYDSEFGTFISFSDEPNLQLWAEQNIPGLRPNTTGLRIGKENNTFFGREDNKWFTASSNELRTSPRTKDKIIELVRQINIK